MRLGCSEMKKKKKKRRRKKKHTTHSVESTSSGDRMSGMSRSPCGWASHIYPVIYLYIYNIHTLVGCKRVWHGRTAGRAVRLTRAARLLCCVTFNGCFVNACMCVRSYDRIETEHLLRHMKFLGPTRTGYLPIDTAYIYHIGT